MQRDAARWRPSGIAGSAGQREADCDQYPSGAVPDRVPARGRALAVSPRRCAQLVVAPVGELECQA